MSNWMTEFLKEFPDATERLTGTRQRLDLIEASLSDARRFREVTAEALHILENSKDWSYPIWWPLLSKNFGAPIKLPQDFDEVHNRRRAIQTLLDSLHHIEVVSVVLRFLFPEEFGIISPPVCALLNMPPMKDHVSYYMHYLEILRPLGDHYGLTRIADVDMALWSAAHSQQDLPAIAQLMYKDEYFQEIRLKNIFTGLGALHVGSAGSPLEKHRLIEHLLIARALLAYDHVLAALICGRTFESIIDLMSSQWGIPRGIKSLTQSEFRGRLKKIGQLPEFIDLGYTVGDLNRWWDWRNDAAHPEHCISRKNAKEFIKQVSDLGRRLLSE